jgi:hypothetical protein
MANEVTPNWYMAKAYTDAEVDALAERQAMEENARIEMESGKLDHDIDRMMADAEHHRAWGERDDQDYLDSLPPESFLPH